jgi:sensor histidine kinase YesM
MLLSVFIENAFKHGVLNEIDTPITIFICVKHETIFFNISNKKAIKKNIETTGIGLVNTKQILNLFYKDKHTLTINETETMYFVELTLKTI